VRGQKGPARLETVLAACFGNVGRRGSTASGCCGVVQYLDECSRYLDHVGEYAGFAKSLSRVCVAQGTTVRRLA
jgi:hypothetical protein